MNIYRRLVRLIKTLFLVPILTILKLISAVSVVLAVIIEGFGFAFFGTLFGSWLLGEMSKKVSYLLLFAEELQLWILENHVIANQKYLKTLGVVKVLSQSDIIREWPQDKPTPRIDPSEVN